MAEDKENNFVQASALLRFPKPSKRNDKNQPIQSISQPRTTLNTRTGFNFFACYAYFAVTTLLRGLISAFFPLRPGVSAFK